MYWFLYNFPYYRLAGDFERANENVIDVHGKPVALVNDDGMKRIHIMDFGKPSARRALSRLPSESVLKLGLGVSDRQETSSRPPSACSAY